MTSFKASSILGKIKDKGDSDRYSDKDRESKIQ